MNTKASKATSKDVKSSHSDAKKAQNSLKQPKRPATAGSFKPGQSGNPGGRKKLTEAQQDALDMIKNLAPRAAAVAGEMLEDPTTPAPVRIKIVEMILDRTYGKPTQSVELDQIDTTVRIVMDKSLEGYCV